MIFCIGDIHGHFDRLKRLMQHCRNFAEAMDGHDPQFILLGDYVDRGPHSRQVIEFLASKPTNVRAICGNHEDMMLESRQGGPALARWLGNGGGETLQSYGARHLREIPPEHLDMIAELPTFIDDGLRLFVHAGIDPQNPSARDRQTLLWTRKHPPADMVLDRFIVHGHTPVTSGRPELLRNRLNLDTGAGWGRHLSAAAFDSDSPRPSAFLDDQGGTVIISSPESRQTWFQPNNPIA
jgi:serine/threonine protein phosphatase 1